MISTVVPARRGVAVKVVGGERLRVVNTGGGQVVDFWAFFDSTEWVSMSHTHVHSARIIPRPGDALWTNLRRPLLTMTADTSGGVHDTQVAACDPERYRLLGWDGFHDSCENNLHNALAGLGMEIGLTPAPLNLFMNVPIGADGSLQFAPSVAPAGSYVEFQAEDDLVAVVSSCPQDLIPISGVDGVPKPVAVEVRTDDK